MVAWPSLGKILLFVLVLLTSLPARAQTHDSLVISSIPSPPPPDSVITRQPDQAKTIPQKAIKPKRRLVAALLCVALGPFGMHRLYLGTKPHVAAAYTLTLGGGLGLVPLIDLFHIVFDPNLYKYKDNDKFIMWVK